MGFGPGCHEVRTGSAYVACPGCDGLVKLATCSHMRSIAQHDVPTSARHVYGNLRDKWTCQARLNAFGATLSPWHDKLTFATSQQTFRRRLCFRSMCKWTPDFQALPVLPLAIIRPPCIVPWIVDRSCSLLRGPSAGSYEMNLTVALIRARDKIAHRRS